MEYDAFSAGIEPGGLRNTHDIGILICYLLDKVNGSLSVTDLNELVQANGLANYFECNAALSELVEQGNIVYDRDFPEQLMITENGRMISGQLNEQLSLSLRQKALSALMQISEKHRIERENPVSITPDKNGGYHISMHINDGIRDLMELTLFVPDKHEANLVKRNFHSNPERLYSIILAAVIGEKDMINNALKELQNG